MGSATAWADDGSIVLDFVRHGESGILVDSRDPADWAAVIQNRGYDTLEDAGDIVGEDVVEQR